MSFVSDGNRIFAGLTRAADFFVWYSDDFGSSWNPLYHEFQGLKKLFIFDNKIWAATNDGLYFTNLPPLNVEPDLEIKNFVLEQNYPNPFNPKTIIQYAIGNRQLVSIKVYNILGNEVATVVNEYKEAGKYQVEFDASNLSSGVYYYRLQTDNVSLTKKMILQR